MTTVIEAGLSVSLDLSSVVEAAVRVAVCSVLKEVQRLIGKDVAELRVALSRKECENEKLKTQLDMARRELRDRTSSEKRSILNSDLSSSCNEDASGNNTSSRHGVRSNTDEDPSGLALDGSSIWSHPWDSDAGSDMQHNFIDPLENIESKRDFTPDVGYSLDAAETNTEPNPTCELLDSIADSVAVTTASITSHGESAVSNVNLVDAHTTKELRVVQVKEEISSGLSSSTAHGLSHPDKAEPYICGECGKSYFWLSSLKKHQKTHQRTHTNPRPHRCTDCPKTFSYLSSLKKHLLIHTGEKPHHCSLCGKRFRQIQHLKEHCKTHEDSKPFRCGECGWGFNNGSNFKRHLLIHTRQKAD
ncbi:zinc finger protein 239-like [Anguilla anguilla]|uniref:zinc finger protein 239-like n=1 Tax=Anguilla anguilla TaxID=7936 RepID=UPI0015B09E9C|nr:zinc finger protein 239-like [Anguilla anguilla]